MQELVVAIIVAGAVLYALLRLLPAGLRQRLAQQVGKLGHMLGLSAERADALTQRLEQGGGCGTCKSCKGCATPAEKNGSPMQVRK
jgi:hypothetical protein